MLTPVALEGWRQPHVVTVAEAVLQHKAAHKAPFDYAVCWPFHACVVQSCGLLDLSGCWLLVL
jgi:hypothetical protein